MLEYIIALSCIFFLLSLIPGKNRKYFAIMAWITLVLICIGGVPEWMEENNIMYPVMAILSIPFLYVTVRLLLADNQVVYSLTRAAAIAFLIYSPFAFVPEIGNWLISVVVGQTEMILGFIGYQVDLVWWNIFQRSSFRVEIILACTGIQAIAIMLGVSAAVPTTTRQKILACLLIVPPIYILNLFRNVGVIIAYTSQWFSDLPNLGWNDEPGFSSFFWAHNVIAEGFALLFLIVLAYGLFRLIPQLADYAVSLIDTYRDEIRKIVNKGR